MTYFDDYASVGDRMDAKCGKGWEGVKGRCERNKIVNKANKALAPLLMGTSAALLTGGILFAGSNQVKSDLKKSEIPFDPIRQPPNGVPDKETFEKYETFKPGDLIRKNFKSERMGNRQHYAVYIGKDPETGEHMLIDTGENWKSRDNIPYVRKRGLTWDAGPNDSEYEVVPVEAKGESYSREEILRRADKMLYSPFTYKGFESNCEAFARMIVEGKAYSTQKEEVSQFTDTISAIVTDAVLHARTKNEYFPGASREQTIFRGGGIKFSGLSDYATIKGKMTAKQMQEHLEIESLVKKGKASTLDPKILATFLANERYINIRRNTWEWIPNPYTGEIEALNLKRKGLPSAGRSSGQIKSTGNLIPAPEIFNKAMQATINEKSKRKDASTSVDVNSVIDGMNLVSPSKYAGMVNKMAKSLPSNEAVFKIEAYKNYLMMLMALLYKGAEK